MAVVAAATVVVAAAFLYVVDPQHSACAPKCLFRLVTGLACPGCGSQRALHALLHLRIGEALAYNALLVIAIPFISTFAVARAIRERRPRLYDALNSRKVCLTVLAVIVAWWVLRNLFPCLSIG